MKSRWFHPPRLHSPGHGSHRKVGWLELFYDLIYVATIIQLGNALAEMPSFAGFMNFALLFAPIWLAWTSFTFYVNRFILDDFAHRALVFMQMFAVGCVAVFVHLVFKGDGQAFALAYGAVRIGLVLMYLRVWLQLDRAKGLTRRYTIGFSIGAAIWITSAFVPWPWIFVLWGLAIVIELSVPFNRVTREFVQRYPPDVIHMSERYGLLTIIVLGEAFVKVLSAVSEVDPTVDVIVMGGLCLLITCSLWWIYFDDVAGSLIKKGRLNAYTWIYTHLPLTIGITAVGVGIKKVVFFDIWAVGPAGYRWLLCGTLALVFASVAVIDSVSHRHQSEVSDDKRVKLRVFCALFVLLLAPAGQFMPAVGWIAAVAAVCVGQVIFDIWMAPIATDLEALEHMAQDSMPVPEEDSIPTAKSTRRWDITDAIRRGAPSELKRDLYFHFMEGSWFQLLASMVVLYIVTNAIFAILFLLEPGSVSGIDANSFFDAFAFSVQTMSTIGYGTMSPTTDYAHMLVTIEAAISILGVALATGVIFAKLSRPTASVLFADPILITTHDGVKTLMFRAGNARGNEIVEATMTVSALCDEVSPEGHRFRRLYDVELVRTMSPTFTLSWTVMHKIDESSPFHGITEDNLEERVVSVIVSMKGHDATYAQQTHARHIYYPENFEFERDYVDVISQMDDGRMLVDYDVFHATKPAGGHDEPDHHVEDSADLYTDDSEE